MVKKTKSNMRIFSLFMLLCVTAYSQTNEINIIPKPSSLTKLQGSFELNASTVLIIKGYSNSETALLERRFKEEIFKETHLKLTLVNEQNTKNKILLKNKKELEEEAYNLIIDNNHIQIEASTTMGAYYALQTLKQLLPIKFAGITKPKTTIYIPCLEITDQPAFAWRGYMLDVSRHFYSKEKIKEVIDFMSSIKLNRFHWHLTDDQGWRIEIKKYPKLTQIGAWRVDHNTTNENINNWWGTSRTKRK